MRSTGFSISNVYFTLFQNGVTENALKVPKRIISSTCRARKPQIVQNHHSSQGHIASFLPTSAAILVSFKSLKFHHSASGFFRRHHLVTNTQTQKQCGSAGGPTDESGPPIGCHAERRLPIGRSCGSGQAGSHSCLLCKPHWHLHLTHGVRIFLRVPRLVTDRH